jgi:hypothetical protein
MSTPTFLQILQAEVARMQTLHPERLGELARAHALILHGQVLPSDDDPATGSVLSSDGEKRYTVNGTCDCQAGQHGKGCKHMQAWKLYQYIARKVEATPTPPALPEAPASVNCHLTIAGRQVQLTLRDTNEGRLLERLQAVLALSPQPALQAPAQLSPPQHNAAAMHRPVTGLCAVHNVAMQLNQKEGRSWYSHRLPEGGWCKGK